MTLEQGSRGGLPEQFINRWRDGLEAQAFRDAVCWHLLLGKQPSARMIARQAQQRLGEFAGLHMTPLRWLHITVLLVGSMDALTHDQMNRMLVTAEPLLSEVPPLHVTLSRVLYHPEGIALGIRPSNALRSIFEAVRAATSDVTGSPGLSQPPVPHVTICYSTSEQPAAPLIAALGTELPTREVSIEEVSLVVQRGSETSWNWHVAGSVRLPGRVNGS